MKKRWQGQGREEQEQASNKLPQMGREGLKGCQQGKNGKEPKQATIRKTACQIHKDVLPGRGQINRQSTRSELVCRLVSGSVKADLVATAVQATEILWAQLQIAPGF